MIPADELVERGEALARAVADAALGGPVHVRTEASRVEWDDHRNRHVHEQELSIWKAFALLDVILDEQQRVVGFVDHEAYRRADDSSGLGDEDIRGLVADDELLPAHTRVVGHAFSPGPEGGRLIGVTVEHGERRWLVEINPARRVIAAVRPL